MRIAYLWGREPAEHSAALGLIAALRDFGAAIELLAAAAAIVRLAKNAELRGAIIRGGERSYKEQFAENAALKACLGIFRFAYERKFGRGAMIAGDPASLPPATTPPIGASPERLQPS